MKAMQAENCINKNKGIRKYVEFQVRTESERRRREGIILRII